MLNITAIIFVKAGTDQAMRDALLAVAGNVRLNEPQTIGFFVSQDAVDPCGGGTGTPRSPAPSALRSLRQPVVLAFVQLLGTRLEPLSGSVVSRTCIIGSKEWQADEAKPTRDDEGRLRRVVEPAKTVNCS